MEDRPACSLPLKIIRLWRLHAYLDLMWMTQDLRNFVTCVIADMFIAVASVTAILLLAARFNGIGAWGTYQLMFMLGYGCTVRASVDMVFGYNIAFVSRRIGRGQLDHTLAEPQPVWVTLATEGFMPFSGACQLLPGIAMLCWSISAMHLHVTPGWLTLFALNGIGSAAVLLAFSFLWASLAFWAPVAAEEISTAAMGFMEELRVFPLNGFGGLLVTGLLSILPVGFVAWYPCQYLVGVAVSSYGPVITPGAGLLLVTLAACALKRGLTHYARTGSPRYNARGHRC